MPEIPLSVGSKLELLCQISVYFPVHSRICILPCIYVYVTGSEKTPLIILRIFTKHFFALERKAYIRSIVCGLFQARSPFRCEVMIANAGAVPLRLT